MKTFSLLSRVVLILASACLALACSKSAASTTQPNVAHTLVAVTASPTPMPAQNPEDKMTRISAEEAKKLVDAGKAVMVDVRSSDAYKISHIKGALEYPLSKIDAKDFSGLPKNKRIIAYCTCGAEHSSAHAVYVLSQDEKFKDAAALLGSMAAWESAGYPMVKAPPAPTQ